MSEVNRYHVFVNTQLRTSSSKSASDFSLAVNPPLMLNHPNNYFVCQIMSVEIPYTWFQVNSSNNTLQIGYNLNTTSFTNYTITILAGNYNINQLILALGNAIDSVIPTRTYSYNIVYDPVSGKLSFGLSKVAPLPTVIIAINFPANPFLARMFGCLGNSNIVFGYSNSLYHNVSSSTNVNVNPVSSIYIRSTNLKQIKNQENLVLGYGQDPSDILCKIQVMTPPKTYVYYNGELGLSARISNPIIDKLDIYLSDNYSFGMDLNSNDWTFRISFYEMKPVESLAHTATLDYKRGVDSTTQKVKKEEPIQEEQPDETIKQKRYQK